MRMLLPAVSLFVAAFLAAQEPEATKPQATNPDAVQAKATNPIVTIETSMGTIVAELYADAAPQTVANFVGLAEGTKEWTTKSGEKVKRPFYDGLLFHRVIKDFMIQGGCPQGDGTGGPGYRFEDEFNYEKLGLTKEMAVDEDGRPSPLAGQEIQLAQRAAVKRLGIKSQEEFDKRRAEVLADLQKQSVADLLVASGRKDDRKLKAAHRPVRGALAMANSGPDTNGSQFFINLVDTPWLTGRHTVFGHVIKGMDVVDKIGNVRVSGGADKPKEDVTIRTIRLTEPAPGQGK